VKQGSVLSYILVICNFAKAQELDKVGIKHLGLEHNGDYEWPEVEQATVDPEVITFLYIVIILGGCCCVWI
jgi:hypothetical protein